MTGHDRITSIEEYRAAHPGASPPQSGAEYTSGAIVGLIVGVAIAALTGLVWIMWRVN